MWYTYIILCSDGTLYTGITNNLEKRIMQHNAGRGAKYTRGRTPVILVCYFEMKNKSDAAKEEYRIKSLPREDKLKLCNINVK